MVSKITCVIATAMVCFVSACSDDSVGANASSTDASVSNGNDTMTPLEDNGPGPMIDAPFDGGTPASPECDLNGRWLVSQRVLATALGQKQAAHNWFYFEITQSGENITVTKGLHCGYEVTKVTSLGANVSCQAAWPGILKNCTSTGRKGHYKLVGDSCQFDLEKQYVVRGATESAYLDPSVPLPSNQAMGTTPGWEDWDMDAKQGITMNVSGGVTGKIYVVQRDWNEYVGTTLKSATKFMLPVKWNGEQKILGSTSSLLETASQPDSDASQHFVWWHKLTPEQASGTDADICAAVRTLKDTLVPEANK